MSDFWNGALVSALVGLVGSVITFIYTRKTEHQKWLREERLRAYTAYWQAMREATQYLYDHWSVNPVGDEGYKWVQLTGQVQDSHFVASLLATQAVTKAMDEYRQAMLSGQWPMRDRGNIQDGARRVNEAARKFRESIRVEFGLAADKNLGFTLGRASAPSVDNPD